MAESTRGSAPGDQLADAVTDGCVGHCHGAPSVHRSQRLMDRIGGGAFAHPERSVPVRDGVRTPVLSRILIPERVIAHLKLNVNIGSYAGRVGVVGTGRSKDRGCTGRPGTRASSAFVSVDAGAHAADQVTVRGGCADDRIRPFRVGAWLACEGQVSRGHLVEADFRKTRRKQTRAEPALQAGRNLRCLLQRATIRQCRDVYRSRAHRHRRFSRDGNYAWPPGLDRPGPEAPGPVASRGSTTRTNDRETDAGGDELSVTR